MREIIHLIDSGGLYGAERVVLYLMLEQRRLGHSVTLVSYGAKGAEEKPLEREARRLGLPLHVWRGSPWSRLRAELEKEGEGRVYHSHGYKFNILLTLAGREARRRHICVATVHGFTDAPLLSKLRLYYALDRWSLRQLDGAAFVSEQTALESGFQAGQGRYQVINNGIPGAEKAPDSAPTAESLGVEGDYILALGRLSREKGIDLLIKAFAHQLAEHPRLSLIIAGDGPEKERLLGLSVALNVADRVHFTGYIAEPQALLSEARLLAMPSLREGLPITLLEAMRAGVDVLASAVGEIPSVTGHGEAARLVPPGRLAPLSDALSEALSSPRGRWGTPAGELFKKRYTAPLMAGAYQRWYGAVEA